MTNASVVNPTLHNKFASKDVATEIERYTRSVILELPGPKLRSRGNFTPPHYSRSRHFHSES